MKRSKWLGYVLMASAIALPVVAHGSLMQLSNLVVLGDSLSDTGNSKLLSQGATGGALTFPPFPYADGRFSNGPVAVEYLWSLYNPGDTSFQPSLAGGTSYAIGGATSGRENYISLNGGLGGLEALYEDKGGDWQLAAAAARASSLDPATSLFVVWLFANDVFYYLATGVLPDPNPGPPPADVQALIANGVTNIVGAIETLAQAGARHFLVPSLADLGATPEFFGNGDATLLTAAFNASLASALTSLGDAWASIEIVQFDTNAAFQAVIANKEAYGLEVVDKACVDFLASGQCNPDTWMFWDGVHPTTRTHRILASQFKAAVPEPSGPLLFLSGLLALAVVRWRRPV